MDKQEPEEGADPKDPSKLGDKRKNFTAGGKISLMQVYCIALMVNQASISMDLHNRQVIPSHQWSLFVFVFLIFGVDVVDDTARSCEAGDGGSGEGVEPAEEEGSMPNGMEIEEMKDSSQGEAMEAVIFDEQ